MQKSPLDAYAILRKRFSEDIKGPLTRAMLTDCFAASLRFISRVPKTPLLSLVPNKKYFAFSFKKKLSRAVNADLYSADLSEWESFTQNLVPGKIKGFDAERITRLIYTVAMSFCCSVDLLRVGDQKTPGTFFEYLIAHLFASQLQSNPKTRIQVMNLDDVEMYLPTDFTFNLGPDRPKFHLPIKTSTRERVIQVWAHQRVLDGVFGTGRFLGTPVILAETKTNKSSGEVIEICLPEQWRIYQLHIAQLKRIYYLDVPATYDRLNDVFPPVHVKPFGEFFFEAEALSL